MKTLKQTTTLMAFALLAIAFISSCKKEESDDTMKPVITIEEPTSGDTISHEVHVEFTVTDDVGLKDLKVKINDNTGAEVFIQNPTVTDLKTFSFHDHYEAHTITKATDMMVTITATDKSSNTETKIIPIVVVP